MYYKHFTKIVGKTISAAALQTAADVFMMINILPVSGSKIHCAS